MTNFKGIRGSQVEVPIDDWQGTAGQALALVFVHTTWDTDRSYGSDADGRRGMSVTFVDHNIEIKSLEDPDGQPADVALLTEAQRQSIREYAIASVEQDEQDRMDAYEDDQADRAYDDSFGEVD